MKTLRFKQLLKLSAIILTMLFATIPLSAVPANAQTFGASLPNYGLYCENQNADMHGNIKYVVDENGKAVQYADYTVSKTDGNTALYIPFVSTALELPKIDVSVSYEICYGDKYSTNSELKFYSSEIDESIRGTLYSISSPEERFMVDFSIRENQNFIYLFNQSATVKSQNGKYSYTVNDALPQAKYMLFIINGDCTDFLCSAKVIRSTMSVKEFFDQYSKMVYELGTDFTYALLNMALDKNINFNFFDLFIDCFNELRLIAYKINVKTNQLPFNFNYSMPVTVQKNSDFEPELYMIENTVTGNYCNDYTVVLNRNLRYLIESSETMKKKKYTYSAQNINDDFYFIFSSEKIKTPMSHSQKIMIMRIIIFPLLGLFVCAVMYLIITKIRYYIKSKRKNR